MKTNKLIHDNDFCMIASDQFEKDTGVKNGTRVFVVGHRALPEDEHDPYTQRIKFFVHLVEKKHVQFDKGLFLMDPKSLRKVKVKEQHNLTAILEEDVDLAGALIKAEEEDV
jgi:hypothetical protein